ncbi:hypothetical protein [Leuconostoc pseudomesenteroides]|uniref:hypothetical protein n=1 Tax=Leuconostoc pseudomesenteroides TaxID=33968 RepID=UPI0015E014A0|nr:hypothetical protein [Leuconostoc pseudomesenteroides]
MKLQRDIQSAYFNINQNIQVVLDSDKLTYDDKERVLNAIDEAVYKAVDENCELPE